jgi:hypothetical protein
MADAKRMTDAEVTRAAKSLLKTSSIKSMQDELAKLDKITHCTGEQLDWYYVLRRAMRFAGAVL